MPAGELNLLGERLVLQGSCAFLALLIVNICLYFVWHNIQAVVDLLLLLLGPRPITFPILSSMLHRRGELIQRRSETVTVDSNGTREIPHPCLATTWCKSEELEVIRAEVHAGESMKPLKTRCFVRSRHDEFTRAPPPTFQMWMIAEKIKGSLASFQVPSSN